jgi:hypothetical protein
MANKVISKEALIKNDILFTEEKSGVKPKFLPKNFL